MSKSHIANVVIHVRKGEDINSALRRFKRKVKEYKVILDYRNYQSFEKPSHTKRLRNNKAKKIQHTFSVKEKEYMKSGGL